MTRTPHPDETHSSRCVVAVVENLIDSAPLQEAAKRLDVPLVVANLRSAPGAWRRESPRLVVFDLALPGVMTLLADSGLQGIATIGFYPHVDQELRRAALEAGLGRAFPRSAFFSRLPALLAEP